MGRDATWAKMCRQCCGNCYGKWEDSQWSFKNAAKASKIGSSVLGAKQLSKRYLRSFTLSMDDSPTSRSRGRAPTFSFHDLDNPPLSSPSVGAAQPSSPSILLSPKRGNVRTSRTKNSPTRTQLTTAFANKGKFAHPKTEKVWKYPSATNQKAGEIDRKEKRGIERG